MGENIWVKMQVHLVPTTNENPITPLLGQLVTTSKKIKEKPGHRPLSLPGLAIAELKYLNMIDVLQTSLHKL